MSSGGENNSTMQPPLNEGDEGKEDPPSPLPCCWICSKSDEDQSVLCRNCDSDGHAHIKCIVNQARAKNEKDYSNYTMATTVEDEKSLEKEYNSFKLTLEEPWLKCGRCGENYHGSSEKLLADEFFEYYKNRGGGDIRTCIAVFAKLKADSSNLGNNKWSEEPYKKIHLFKQVVDSWFSQENEAKLLTRFKAQIESDIADCICIGEYCLPPKTTPKPPEAACWICLDDEPDEHGAPLERTCACRGSSGYCHINCISNYALEKNTTSMKRMMTGMTMSTDEWNKEMSVPWTQCPTCNQEFTGTFACKLAYTFYMQYENNPYNELMRQVSLETFMRVCLQTSYHDTGIAVMKKQINLIRTMRQELRTGGKIASGFYIGVGDPNTQKLAQQLCDDYCKYCLYLVGFYKAKGENKLANDVLRELKTMGVETLATGGPGVDGSLQISIEDMLNNVDISEDKSVKWRKAEIRRLTKECGKDTPEILDHKFSLSQDLMRTKSFTEGIALMFEVVGDATRILGPEHPKTVEYSKYTTMFTQAFSNASSEKKESQSSHIVPPQTKVRLISDIPALNGKTVNAVRYTKDGKKLIVDFLEPIPNKPNRVKIPPDQLIFGLKTTVMTPGKKIGMITSFDTETKKYSVMPLGEMAVERYKQSELVILFQSVDTQTGALVY